MSHAMIKQSQKKALNTNRKDPTGPKKGTGIDYHFHENRESQAK